ncbi:hypothetical protein ACFQ0K_02465 [Nocardioides caeni]|uniref:Uncharacterized protein n=1 Tax=Nocardioides caeni TaxID=574700 RepID=A0A4S8NSU4_9ACTN|nr:hypothetical protein [Nocardioides caeni]THV18304.1 hypothetical protein E9934_01315 [Nocardioides caeni]
MLVNHYAHPEPAHLKRLLGQAEVADLLDRLHDEDPGGLQPQLWLIEARTADDAAVRDAGRRRILAYNEDDVRATYAICNGL